jgi:hypothetical protein
MRQNPSSFSSLQQLLGELENLILLESNRSGKPWISVARLSKLFHEKRGVSLKYIVQAKGYSDSLRSLFTSSKRFSIYGTQAPQEFYIALLHVVVPSCNQNQTKPIQYRIKRPWKVDGNLLRTLKAEGAKEIPSRWSQKIPQYQPILVVEIKSVDDLETVLVEVIKNLTIHLPKRFVTVATLSQKFHDYYKQPIRSVVRSVCPTMKLIDLLQVMPKLHLQKVDNDWQITLKVSLME